ncbi:MAG: hypothetical protein ACLFVK_06050 [Dehalococcoidia bacterium]
MRKVKPIWYVPTILLFLLGIAALVPVSYFPSPFFDGYHTLLPLAPVLTMILWILGCVVYLIGRRTTQGPIKRPK